MILAGRFGKKSPDHLALPWTLATLGGTLLWVSIGECSWHFGLNVVSDEGKIIFTNFPRIESVQGIPFMILTLIAFGAARKKASFPLMSYSLAFAANWYGHLCMMRLYPIAMVCGMKVELPVFYRASGLIHTFIFAHCYHVNIFKLYSWSKVIIRRTANKMCHLPCSIRTKVSKNNCIVIT